MSKKKSVMKKSSVRLGLMTLILSIPLVPIWVLLGRSIFGVGGWGQIGMTFTLVPAFFVYHVVLLAVFLSLSRKPVFIQKSTAKLLAAYYSLHVLYQFTFVDGGDTPESVKSVFTVFFGKSIEGASMIISNISFIVLCIVAAWVILDVVRLSRVVSPKTRKK